MRKMNGNKGEATKYEVGEKPNPPKKPRRLPKKGNVTPTKRVNAAKIQYP